MQQMAAFVVTDDTTAYPIPSPALAAFETSSNGSKGKLSNRSLIKLRQEQELSDSDSEEESEEEFFDKEKIKKKFLSAWNNVKYGINVNFKTSFSDHKPVWLLGRCYHSKSQDTRDDVAKPEHKILSLDQFFEDFSSLIWLTYRKHFSQLANSNLTSDGGWGCMLRTGQMLLANAILVHMLKEGWRQSQRNTCYEKNYIYRMIVRFFNDESSDYSPFSLHELVRIGETIGKKVGDWYGPSTVSYTLRNAVNGTSHPTLETFRIYVARDCTIYKEDVMRICTKCKNCTNPSCQDKFWRSLLIMVPMRLGADSLNQIYTPCIESMLAHDMCVGIIGGRPKHSLYFVGFQGHKLIHLDPHYLQEKVDMSGNDFLVDSFRCLYPKKMKFYRMDPSCAVGFYCRTKEDFDAFCNSIGDLLTPPLQQSEYPIFSISEGSEPCYSGPEADGFISVSQYSPQVDVGDSINSSYKTGQKTKSKKKDKNKKETPPLEQNVSCDEYVVVE